MTPVFAWSCVLLALPGLLLARYGSTVARVLALLALLALAIAATDPLRLESTLVPPRVEVVVTDVGAPLPAELRTLAAPGDAARRTDADGPWLERLAAAALRAGSDPGELVVVWNGAIPGATATATPISGRSFAALAVAPPLPIAPEDLQVRAASRLAVGRPVAFECQVAGLPETATVELIVRDPDGREVLTSALPVSTDVTRTEPWHPEVAGVHEVICRLRLQGAEIVRRGRIAIESPPRVLVVGPTAEGLAQALSVQGVAAVVEDQLPAELEPYAAVVATGELSAVEQDRLRTRLEDGAGVLLVGAAVPAPDQPLHEVLPVTVVPFVAEGVDGNGPGPAEEPGPQPPEPGVEPPPPPPSEPVDPGGPPGGDTQQAQPGDGPPVEVEKRSVAMVLVIDRSGSMGRLVDGRNTTMDFAKTSGYQTARALGEGDEVAVITFGDQNEARLELPLTAATERRAIRERLERLSHHIMESTYLASGFRMAGRTAEASRAAVKHVVVISDGVFMDGGVVLTKLARELAEKGMTVSIILVEAGGFEGPMLATKMRRITEAGGGKYHATRDARLIPRLVSLEVTRSLERVGRQPGPARPGPGEQPASTPDPPSPEVPPPAEDEPEPGPEPPPPEPKTEPVERMLRVRAVADSPLLEPRPADEWPSVGGLVRASGRADAQILLVAGREGWPLLALANRGLGRIATWTADFLGPHGGDWPRDPGFPGRLAQWVEALLPATTTRGPGDILTATEILPAAPTPAEMDALAAWSGGPVLRSDDHRAPLPREGSVWRGQAAEWAIFGAALLLLLALGEYLLLRLRA